MVAAVHRREPGLVQAPAPVRRRVRGALGQDARQSLTVGAGICGFEPLFTGQLRQDEDPTGPQRGEHAV